MLLPKGSIVTDDDPNKGVEERLDVISIGVVDREMLLELHVGN